MAQREVNILVRARDEASKVFRGIEAAARQLMGIKQQADAGGGRSEEFNLIRSIALVGKLNAAIGVANVLTDIFKGNLDDAAESLKNMPMGIGGVVRQFEILLGNVTGLTAETERIKRETELLENINKTRLRIADLTRQALKQQADEVLRMRRELQAMEMGPGDAILFNLQIAFSDRATMAKEAAEAQIRKIREEANKQVRELNEQLSQLPEIVAQSEREARAMEQRRAERTPLIQQRESILRRVEEEEARIREGLAEQLATIEATSNAKQLEAQRRLQESREAIIRHSEDRIAALWAQAREVQLRAAGQHYQADLIALQQYHQMRLRQIEKQAAEELKLHPEMADEIRRRAEEEAAAARELLQQQRARAEQERQHDAVRQITDALNAEMIASVREYARMGSKVAEEELRRLQIQQEFEYRRRQLQTVLENEAASMEQKAQAQQLMVELAQQELEALENVNKELERGNRIRGTGVPLPAGLKFAPGSSIGVGGQAVHRDLLTLYRPASADRFAADIHRGPQLFNGGRQRPSGEESAIAKAVTAQRESTRQIAGAIAQLHRRLESMDNTIRTIARDIAGSPILHAEVG